MSVVPGIVLGGPAVPTDDMDTYPVTDPRWGLGGMRTVATTADRNAIPVQRLQRLMFVGVEADGVTYRLKNSWPGGVLSVDADWEAFASTPGGASWTPQGVTTATVGGVASGTDLGTSPVAIETTLRAAFYPYQGPLVSLAILPAAGLREFGDTVTSPVLTPTTTRRSNPITTLTLSRSVVGVISTYATPNPAGATEAPYTDTGTPVGVNTTYTATVGDGTSTSTATRTYSFCYPYYYGVGAPGLSGAAIAGLTKIVQLQANTLTTTSPTSQVYYFAYPAAYPDLSSILDQSGFETILDYTLRTVSITGLDGTSQSYKVYEFNNLTTQVGFRNTYIY
jgi:hypothetical protein